MHAARRLALISASNVTAEPKLRRPEGRAYSREELGGTDSWYPDPRVDSQLGDLENHVLSEAANERLCVFAGPVLAASDEVFVGVGEGRVSLRARIPARFWKVIVARVLDGLAAYGFVLEQDL